MSLQVLIKSLKNVFSVSAIIDLFNISIAINSFNDILMQIECY